MALDTGDSVLLPHRSALLRSGSSGERFGGTESISLSPSFTAVLWRPLVAAGRAAASWREQRTRAQRAGAGARGRPPGGWPLCTCARPGRAEDSLEQEVEGGVVRRVTARSWCATGSGRPPSLGLGGLNVLGTRLFKEAVARARLLGWECGR